MLVTFFPCFQTIENNDLLRCVVVAVFVDVSYFLIACENVHGLPLVIVLCSYLIIYLCCVCLC